VLEDALIYFDTVGVGELARKGRFGDYQRRLSKLVDAVMKNGGTFSPQVSAELEENVTEYRVAWSEALELATAVPYLKTCGSPEVVPKLKRALVGRRLPMDEDASSSDARNIQ
jgi:hypothetical protein